MTLISIQKMYYMASPVFLPIYNYLPVITVIIYQFSDRSYPDIHQMSLFFEPFTCWLNR